MTSTSRVPTPKWNPQPRSTNNVPNSVPKFQESPPVPMPTTFCLLSPCLCNEAMPSTLLAAHSNQHSLSNRNRCQLYHAARIGQRISDSRILVDSGSLELRHRDIQWPRGFDSAQFWVCRHDSRRGGYQCKWCTSLLNLCFGNLRGMTWRMCIVSVE